MITNLVEFCRSFSWLLHWWQIYFATCFHFHFILKLILQSAVQCLVTQLCVTLCDPMVCNLPGSWVHGDSPSKNIGVDCHALLQRIFTTQGSKLGLPHCRQILYHLSHQGSPRILEWVVYPFSRGSSQSRNRIGISCTAGGFSTSWATRKTQSELHSHN